MDLVQVTIVLISFILTFFFVFLGIQVWFILKEMKVGLQKMNKMLDDMGKVTGTVGEGISSIGGFVGGIKSGLSLFTSLRKGGSDE